MGKVKSILHSPKKQKQKIEAIASLAKKDSQVLDQVVKLYDQASDPQKGTLIEVFEYFTQEIPNSKKVKNHLGFLISNLNYQASRVRWEVGRTLGNVAQSFPQKTAQAIPGLLNNTQDSSTVVRWSAAYALTQIARAHPKSGKKLKPKFKNLIKQEKNTGVKKIYLAYLEE